MPTAHADTMRRVQVAEPEVTGCTNRHAGIVLVHGFGAGLFCWRHIMQPLANSTGCRVVAFDRPAFGEGPMQSSLHAGF